jgi:hypothetical protein
MRLRYCHERQRALNIAGQSRYAQETSHCFSAYLCVHPGACTGSRWNHRRHGHRSLVCRCSRARASVTDAQTGLTRQAVSAGDGIFHISNLPVGIYNLSVNAKGFAPFAVTGIRVDIGQVVKYPVRLAVGGDQITITVQDTLLDTSQATGSTIHAAEATDLPLNGRDITQLGLLQPGVGP